MKKILFVVMMGSISFFVTAQTAGFVFAPNVGIGPGLDGEEGLNFHVGLNIAKLSSTKFALEGQFSVISPNKDSDWTNCINLLAGGRYFITNVNAPTRLYLNLLAGGNLNMDVADDFTEIEFFPGFSGGIFLNVDRLLFGVSVDSPQFLLFKAAYVF